MAFDKDHDALKREFSHNLQAFGQNGFKSVGSTPVVGEFVAITALVDSQVTIVIPSGMDADGGVYDLPAGLTIYGKFTSVTANTGKVIAYNLTEG
jgi:hypothetical protein